MFFFSPANFSAPLPHRWRRVFVRLVLVQSVLKKLLEFLAPFSIHTTFPKNKTLCKFSIYRIYFVPFVKNCTKEIAQTKRKYTHRIAIARNGMFRQHTTNIRSHPKCRRKLGKICKTSRSRTAPNDIIFNKVLPATLANAPQQAKRKLVCRFAVISEIVLLMQFFCAHF